MSKTSCQCARCTDGGFIVTKENCPECAGTPFINLDGHTMVCEHCHGTGRRNVPCPDCAEHKH